MRQSALTRRRALLAGVALFGAGAARAATPEVHVRSVGTGAKSWVLLHPYGASGKFWDARAAELAGRHGVAVLCPDLPSHGGSRIVERFTYDAAATAVAAALAGRPAPEVVVGASSGGIVALKLAARLDCPAVGVGVGDAFSPANVGTMRALSLSPEYGNDQWVNTFLEQGEPQRTALRRHIGQLGDSGTGPLFTAAELQALANRTLILNGAKDDFFSPAQAHGLADSIRGCVLTFLTDAGHLEPLGAPWRDVTWAAVEALVARHTR